MANRIYVNREYEKAFDSICKLIQGGCFSGLGWKVSDGIIYDGVYEYQLTTVFKDEQKTVRHGFNKDGATWFKALRGQKVENNNAIWTSFIETVGIEYHKRYSVVEYQQQPKTRAEKEEAFVENRGVIDTFTKLFYPEFHQKTEMVEVDDELTKEDIYGVAMRIELSGGTGASLPILCRVYFAKFGRTTTPIASFISQGIDDNLAEIIPEDSDADQVVSGEGVIDTTLNALDKLINDTNVNFADYVCYGDKSDKVAVDNLLAQLSHDAFELECQRIDVLYITHITANSFSYEIRHAGKPLFRLNSGLNKTITLYCLNCNTHEKLIDSNHITYIKDDKEQTVVLQPELHNFGLSQEQIEEIKQYSGLSDHYIPVSCSLESRGHDCRVLKCKSQVFDADSSEKLLYKCKDCPYPEVVYTTLSGEKKYTPLMVFAKDAMGFIDTMAEDVKADKCQSCGRYFTDKALKNKMCPVCYKASKSDGDLAGKNLYKKYKSLLPLKARLFAFTSKKFCVEDEELIVFVIGNKQYAFNKLSVKEKGYFDSPRRIS